MVTIVLGDKIICQDKDIQRNQLPFYSSVSIVSREQEGNS